MKQIILVVILFSLSSNSFSGESKVKKYFEKKDYGKILEIITSNKSDNLSGYSDYQICGQTAFMFGLYKESSNFYQKAYSSNKNSLKDQDLINYAFCLIKLGRNSEVLSNECFKAKGESIAWLNKLKNIALSSDSLKAKKDTLVSSKKLDVDFLSQYGLSYFDYHIYYSYPRYSGESKGDLPENALMSDRRNELAGIKSTLVNTNGLATSSEILKRTLKGTGRIASMNMTDQNENYFATVVPRKGRPEQIAVHGSLFPGFPYNSDQYANAMPFFDQKSQRLYFCSNMTGGTGGWDIYYCELKNGKWLNRVNMGPKVNTPFDELFPSVYQDLLIFSSEAHEGLGGFDNYLYSLTDNSLKNLWPFNTSGDDLSFRIIQDNPLKAVGVNTPEAKFYLSDSDLKSILNPVKKKPVPTPVVEQPMAQVQVVKPVEKDPVLVVPNILSKEVNVIEKPLVLDMKTTDVLLGNVYYDLNSAVFKSIHYAVLDSIAELIRKNNYSNIVIWSYTDRVGAEQYNRNLSFQRALGVREYLKSKFKDSQNKVYFTVAASEYFADKEHQISASDRKSEVFASERGLPFNIVFAYRPMKGETPESISKTFNNSLEKLKELNLNIPENRTNAEIVYVGVQGIHVASPNETIFGISKKYNCSVEQLLGANHKPNYVLGVAEKLIIPLPISN